MSRFNGLPAKVAPSAHRTRVVRVITIEVECEPEEVPIDGNCMASGDARIDRTQEKWVRHQLEHGNPWAWCSVRVRAGYGEHEADVYLGCCSYLSGDDFCRPGGHFDDMASEAVRAVLSKAADAAKGGAA